MSMFTFIPLVLFIITLLAPVSCATGSSTEKTSRNHSNTAAAFVARMLAAGKKPNSLINQKSPYLLQHAFNPVNWMPWGEEALKKAARESKPIFLSIGYSTCHWCHVMARECFENKEIADFLNKHFICIKVDREERPDLDRIYMTATMVLSGGGGWPMSVFLTPDLKPFYAGTYFPAYPGYGRPGFLDLIKALNLSWQDNPERVREKAGDLTARLAAISQNTSGDSLPDRKILTKAFNSFNSSYDKDFGGFNDAPKFPRPSVYNFLLRYFKRYQEKQAAAMVFKTLKEMAAGGVYDHLGGGFHRYAVDSQWSVPHFEKMLYDQAQLVVSYIEAFQVTTDPLFARIARETIDYVLRDLHAGDGGFFSGEDADSPDPDNPGVHGEGYFYLWRLQEIKRILAPEEADIFSYRYGVGAKGNAAPDPAGESGRRNILYNAYTLEATARRFGKTDQEIREILAAAKTRLLSAREKRPRPHLDDKIITAWNGLMISALSRAGAVLNEPGYLKAAQQAAGFILTTLYDEKSGELSRRYRDGEAAVNGQLDDYAFLTQGLLDLYEAAFDPDNLRQAVRLTKKTLELFYDKQHSGFFETDGRDKTVLFRQKSDYDGAEPAGNSIAALNLLRLAQMTSKPAWRDRAIRTLAAFQEQLATAPAALPQMLCAYDFQLGKPLQIVIAGERDNKKTAVLLSIVFREFLPNKILLLADSGAGRKYLEEKFPFIADLEVRGDKATAYVCRDFTCNLPTSDPAKLKQYLKNLSAEAE